MSVAVGDDTGSKSFINMVMALFSENLFWFFDHGMLNILMSGSFYLVIRRAEWRPVFIEVGWPCLACETDLQVHNMQSKNKYLNDKSYWLEFLDRFQNRKMSDITWKLWFLYIGLVNDIERITIMNCEENRQGKR